MVQISPETARAEIVRLLRTANVTIDDQWEGSTGYISETESGRLADAIAALSAGHAQTPALTDALKEVARLRVGLESIVNCRNPLTRAAVREACAEILAATPTDTSTVPTTVPTHCDNCGLEFKPNDDVFASVNHSVRRTVHLKCPSDTSTVGNSK